MTNHITIQGQTRYGPKSHRSLVWSTTMTLPAQEEGKLLSDALSTVKIHVQQMKRNLVRTHPLQIHLSRNSGLFDRS